MSYQLNKIQIEILDKLYTCKYGSTEGFEIEETMFSLEDDAKPTQELGYYLEDLKKVKYIYYPDGTLRREESIDNKYKSDICMIWWDYISLTREGKELIENHFYNEYIKEKEKVILLRKKEFEKSIFIDKEHDTYYEISISLEDRIVNGIKVDKQFLPLIKEYRWYLNSQGMLYSWKHYGGGKNRNRPIYLILFADEMKKVYETSKEMTDNTKEDIDGNISYTIHFRNGDKLDLRRENIVLKASRTRNVNNKFHKITGIYLSTSNTDNHTSYEVKIKKGNIQKRSIYLIKTTLYREALIGAFMLRLIFWGKEFTDVFIKELDIEECILDELENSISYYLDSGKSGKLEEVLEKFSISENLINKIIDVINNNRDLI